MTTHYCDGIWNGVAARKRLPCCMLGLVMVSALVTAAYGETAVLTFSATNTVDSQGDKPGDDSNNLTKFSTGDGAEFTTTLYVRGSDGDADRQVKAYAKFDLSTLPVGTVTGAVLRFRGYSLNEINPVNLLLDQLDEDWPTSGSPYTPAVTGDAVSFGDVRTSGAPGTGTNFSADVTTIVSNWVEGATNHGFFLRLESMTVNNGLGIKTGGDGAIELEVAVAPAVDALYPHDVTAASASLRGDLVSTGASSQVWIGVFWGTNDAGNVTNTADGVWGRTNWFPDAFTTLGEFSTNVSLDLGVGEYWYRCALTNAAGQWGQSEASQYFLNTNVWITTTGDDAAEPSTDGSGVTPGTFTVHRASFATSEAVTVTYALGGTATYGNDYGLSPAPPGTIELAAGQSNVLIVVKPALDSDDSEGTETITVTLVADGGPYPADTTAHTINVLDTPYTGTLLVYEGFDSTGNDGDDLDGMSGGATSFGFSAGSAWDRQAGSILFSTSGLSFGSGDTILATADGCAYWDENNTDHRMYRRGRLDFSGDAPLAIVGSYLVRYDIYRNDGSAQWGLLVGTNTSITTATAEFGLSGAYHNDHPYHGAVKYQDDGGVTNMVFSGSNTVVGQTFLALMKLENINTNDTAGPLRLSGWVLSSDQFDHFRGGGLTEEELNDADTGTAVDQVWQCATEVVTSTIRPQFTTNAYFYIHSYRQSGATVDELRIGTGSLDEVTPVVPVVPRGSAFLFR